MNVEPTILVLADGQPPEELATELERHHVFTEFTTPAALGDVFDVVAPDLVLLFGRKHFDTTVAFLAHLPEQRRVRLAVLAARSELSSFRDVDRELVATVLSLDISTSALAARLATVALRLAQKIQERSRSVAPPAVTVVKPSVPPPRAPFLPKASEPPRPRAPFLPAGHGAGGGPSAPVSMSATSAGPPRPVMGSLKPGSRRPPDPEPVDDLSDRPTLVRDPLEQSAVTELAFDDRPTIAGEPLLHVDASALELDSSLDPAGDASVPESGKFPVAARSAPPTAPLGFTSTESNLGVDGAGGDASSASPSGASAGRLSDARPSAPPEGPAADRVDDGSLGAVESVEGSPSDLAARAPTDRRSSVLLLGAGCLAIAAGFAWHVQRGHDAAGTEITKSSAAAVVSASAPSESTPSKSVSGASSTASTLPGSGEPPSGSGERGPLALWRVPVEPVASCKELVAPPPEVNAVTVASGNRAWDRARAALVRGDRKAAHVALCDAAQNHPQSLAVEGLVEHYLALHAPEQAKPWLTTALSLRPDRPRTIELEAILESQLGHEDIARRAWQRSVGIAEADTATTVRLARMSATEVDGLLRAGDLSRAEIVARRAATLDPTSAVAAAALASVWLAAGQDGLAALWVARAEELDPKSPEAAVVRGDWHARAGDAAAAKLSYEHAIELEPSNKSAWQKLGGMSGTRTKTAASEPEVEAVTPPDEGAFAAPAPASPARAEPSSTEASSNTSAE